MTFRIHWNGKPLLSKTEKAFTAKTYVGVRRVLNRLTMTAPSPSKVIVQAFIVHELGLWDNFNTQYDHVVRTHVQSHIRHSRYGYRYPRIPMEIVPTSEQGPTILALWG